MGLASATTTALNGLRLNETSIDVLGNNVANAGTRGFKSSEALFTTQLVRTLSAGGGPTDFNGGTNPRQVGLGATVSSIRKDFSQGSVTTSNAATDLAIEGEGFFVMRDGRGLRYTRDGSFTLNQEGALVNSQGLHVQGYGVDGNFNLETTTPQNISVPLGKLYIAEATTEARFTGAFFSGGDLATHGSLVLGEPMLDGGGPPSPASALQDLTDAAGNSLFTAGDEVSFGARKGGRQLGPGTLPVTGSSLQDLMDLMRDTFGLQNGPGVPNDGNTGGPPGVDLSGDRIRVTGNRGTANDLSIAPGDLRSGGGVVPLTFTETEEAVGESAVHDFVVYDSLGQEVQVRLTGVIESRTNTRTDVRWYADSVDDSRGALDIGTGMFRFDGTGEIVDGLGRGDFDRAGEHGGPLPADDRPGLFAAVRHLQRAAGESIRARNSGRLPPGDAGGLQRRGERRDQRGVRQRPAEAAGADRARPVRQRPRAGGGRRGDLPRRPQQRPGAADRPRLLRGRTVAERGDRTLQHRHRQESRRPHHRQHQLPRERPGHLQRPGTDGRTAVARPIGQCGIWDVGSGMRKARRRSRQIPLPTSPIRHPMIPLTRLSGERFLLNADLIRTVETRPDTFVTLTTGERLIVREAAEVVAGRVLGWRRAAAA